MEDAPYERSMMTFINTRSEGLTVLPTHRVVNKLRDFSWSKVRRYLEPWFETEVFPIPDDSLRFEVQERFLNRLVARNQDRAIGVYPAPQQSEPRAFSPEKKPGNRSARGIRPGEGGLPNGRSEKRLPV